MEIEEAEASLRALVRKAGLSVPVAIAQMLPIQRAFCHVPAVAESDMTLWEVGRFGEWVEQPDGDWTETAPRFMFAIVRQLERGQEALSTAEQPQGFYQVGCYWYFSPEDAPSTEFARWRREDESVDDFFDAVEASDEFATVSMLEPLAMSIEDGWV